MHCLWLWRQVIELSLGIKPLNKLEHGPCVVRSARVSDCES